MDSIKTSKNWKRREQYRALGARITATDANAMAWRIHNGDFTGEWKGKACADSELSSKRGGPQFRTMQWEPTAK